MNSKTSKVFMTIGLVVFVAISSMAFTGYRQFRTSGGVAGKFQTGGIKTKTIVAPKADWLDDIVNELLKFIKKR